MLLDGSRPVAESSP